jgi:hypothetical protein
MICESALLLVEVNRPGNGEPDGVHGVATKHASDKYSLFSSLEYRIVEEHHQFSEFCRT